MASFLMQKKVCFQCNDHCFSGVGGKNQETGRTWQKERSISASMYEGEDMIIFDANLCPASANMYSSLLRKNFFLYFTIFFIFHI